MGLKQADKTISISPVNITGAKSGKEILLFREKRTELPKSEHTYADLYIDDNEQIRCDLKNISEFGCRCVLAQGVDHIGENISLKKLRLFISGQNVFDGQAKIVHEVKEAFSIHIGVSFTSGAIDLEKVNSILMVQENSEKISALKTQFNLKDSIKDEFKCLVADFNFLLQKLKQTLDVEEARINEMGISDRSKKKLQEQTINLAISLHANSIHEGVTSFKKIVEGLDEHEQRLYKEYFRTTFHPLLIGTPFIKRAYEKPLGYAGDYGLMLMFYEYEDIGDSLFEKFMHRYACNEPSAVANKNRVHFLSDIMANYYSEKVGGGAKNFKFASIACGPAKESRLLLEEISQHEKSKDTKIEVVLVDHESEALSYAYSSIKMKAYGEKVSVKMIEADAVLGIIKEKAFSSLLDSSDIIVSAGLFDYLSDRVCTKLISSLFNKLNVGGRLIIGNVSSSSPDKFSMEYLMDWKLFYRNEIDLKNLVEKDIVPRAKITTISEQLGLNLFMQIEKCE